MRKSVRLRLVGLVQGVNLRSMIAQQANKLHLVGSVQNERDGTVKVFAEGERPALQKFIAWVKQNPGSSRIDKVEEQWGEETHNNDSLSIHNS